MALKWDYFKFIFHTNLNQSKLESALDSLVSYADTYIKKKTGTTCIYMTLFPSRVNHSEAAIQRCS